MSWWSRSREGLRNSSPRNPTPPVVHSRTERPYTTPRSPPSGTSRLQRAGTSDPGSRRKVTEGRPGGWGGSDGVGRTSCRSDFSLRRTPVCCVEWWIPVHPTVRNLSVVGSLGPRTLISRLVGVTEGLPFRRGEQGTGYRVL